MMEDSRILSINISSEKGVKKQPVDRAFLEEGQGIQGDAHAQGGNRQVSLLPSESFEKMKLLGYPPKPGDFAENLTLRGLDLSISKKGDWLQIGEVILEVTELGKVCHQGCEIQRITGDCIMPREGVFASVKKSGWIHTGDRMIILRNGIRTI